MPSASHTSPQTATIKDVLHAIAGQIGSCGNPGELDVDELVHNVIGELRLNNSTSTQAQIALIVETWMQSVRQIAQLIIATHEFRTSEGDVRGADDVEQMRQQLDCWQETFEDILSLAGRDRSSWDYDDAIVEYKLLTPGTDSDTLV